MAFTNTKTAGVLRIVSLGDIHLGHHQTPTELIIRNLERYALNERTLKDVDLLVLTGDIYDRLLSNADANVRRINSWITRLLYLCARLQVAIRLVEGTPLHDRQQPHFFIDQAKDAKIPVDIHYATTLSIEHMERFGLTILYVPDKWRACTLQTWREVQALLEQEHLAQVDLAIMHGAFEYQLPSVVTEPTHDSDAYQAIVKHLILIGHVHEATHHGKILAAGSYDRTCHGDEIPKGAYDITLRANGEYQVVWLENEGAKRYDTLECYGWTLPEVHEQLQALLTTLPKGSAIRLRCQPGDPVVRGLDSLRQQYPDYEWSILADKDKSATKPTNILDTLKELDLSRFVPITEDNLSDLAMEELRKFTDDPQLLELGRRHLEDLVRCLK